MQKKSYKPKILLSKCIEFESCRYNAQIIRSDFVAKLKEFVDFQTVCPEYEIGLGIPRDPIRIIENKNEKKLVQPATKKDVTDKMSKFAIDFLKKQDDVHGFILKSQSPSCGITDVKIYPRMKKSAPIKRSSGFFGEQVLKNFPNTIIEDEARLRNPIIRDHFLKQVFTMAFFKQVKNKLDHKSLLDFHTQNKFLFMAYSPKYLKKMGNIVANKKEKNVNESIKEYEKNLLECFKNGPKCNANINVLQHAFGYISKKISKKEKQLFLDNIKNYNKGITPLSVPTALLKSWILRFDEDYLRNQTFFEPYPIELSDVEALNICSSRDYWK